MARLKILVAGDPASIHATRFVSLLQDLGHDVRLFHSGYQYGLEEHLRDTVVYVGAFEGPVPQQGNSVRVVHPFEMSYSRVVSIAHRAREPLATLLKRRFDLPPRKTELIRVLQRWRPDLVISLKMQDDGYTVSQAKDELGAGFTPKWIHFSWGTDIEYFGKHPDYAAAHLPRIRHLLSHCDFHMADTKRDVRQARELGFAGVDLGDCLAHGGFDLAELAALQEEASGPRDIILVKGREATVGKAFNVLAALQKIPRLLADYRIQLIMTTPNVRGVADYLTRFGGVACEVLPRLSYRELLKVYARSRVAISASDVDGTPSFLVEAMAMGALPIHSDMESIREWVDDGKNALLFPVDDIDAIAGCIRRAIGDDALVDTARAHNAEITRTRMDRAKIRRHVGGLIEQVAR
jgi:glycosyltransferase involved in cell wall biosynthesis